MENPGFQLHTKAHIGHLHTPMFTHLNLFDLLQKVTQCADNGSLVILKYLPPMFLQFSGTLGSTVG
jgi:hypothetical protein